VSGKGNDFKKVFLIEMFIVHPI